MADVPQVESVALATYSGIPSRSGERSVVEVPGRDMTGDEAPILQRISAHYFVTMKIPLIRGRVWSDSESAGTSHVVLLAVSLVLCVVTMMAAAIPASQAASIQPADALRID